VTASSKADLLNLVANDAYAVSQLGLTLTRLVRCQLEMILGGVYVWTLLGKCLPSGLACESFMRELTPAGPSGLWGLSALLITSIPAYFITKLQYKIFEKRLAVSDKKLTLLQEAIQSISQIKVTATERFWYARIRDIRNVEFERLTQARILGFIAGML
jgi:ABC-type multidrug transport system fused ATPase/permease subunit